MDRLVTGRCRNGAIVLNPGHRDTPLVVAVAAEVAEKEIPVVVNSLSVRSRPARSLRSLRSLDPFEIEPTALSGAELAWLAEQWPLTPAADGPLGFLRTEPQRLTDGERRRAEAGLRAKGLLRQEDAPVPMWELDRTVVHGGMLRRSLAILERPEARIRIGIEGPGEPSRQVPLYVAGEEAALGARRGECFLVGPPIRTTALVTGLYRHLESEPPEGVGSTVAAAAALWPFWLDVVAALWPAGTERPWRALPRARAVASLAALGGDDTGQAEELLDGLVAAGIARIELGGVAPAPAYRPWLEAMMSGDRLEVEHTPLHPAAGEGEPDEPDRLLFAGPAGRRVVCGYLDRALLDLEGGFGVASPLGDNWADNGPWRGGGGERTDDGAWPGDGDGDRFLFVTHLSSRALAVRLRELLRL